MLQKGFKSYPYRTACCKQISSDVKTSLSKFSSPIWHNSMFPTQITPENLNLQTFSCKATSFRLIRKSKHAAAAADTDQFSIRKQNHFHYIHTLKLLTFLTCGAKYHSLPSHLQRRDSFLRHLHTLSVCSPRSNAIYFRYRESSMCRYFPAIMFPHQPPLPLPPPWKNISSLGRAVKENFLPQPQQNIHTTKHLM